MCGSSPTPPTPPNPQQVAQAQTQSNLQTATANAELNRVNTSTPYGSLNYNITGYNKDGTPIYGASVNLSPQQQQLYNLGTTGQIAEGNTALGMLSGVQGLQKGFNASTLPGITSQVTNGANNPQAIQDAERAAFNTQEQFLQPIQQQDQTKLDDQLRNQGLQPGSEAYNNAEQVLRNSQNQQTQSALNSAVTAGQGEQNTLYGQGIAGANLQNTSNAQALGQALQLRELPLNEFNALQSGSQVHQPNFPTTPSANVAPTDISSDIYNSYQGQLNTYAAQMGAQNSMNAGLFGLLGAGVKGAFTLSDERAKKRIHKVGETPGGHNVYEYEYKEGFDEPFSFGKKHIGVMAQEAEKKQPHAVMRGPDGMRRVNYAEIR